MKVNTPNPALTRVIARRLAKKVATLKRGKGKPIKKLAKSEKKEASDASG
jgi:hypothetical protein